MAVRAAVENDSVGRRRLTVIFTLGATLGARFGRRQPFVEHEIEEVDEDLFWQTT